MATVLKQPPAATLDRLKTAVGAQGWTAHPAEMSPLLLEERGHYRGRADLLLRPSTTAEVAAVVKICAENGTAVVPQGGNTGMMGGATPFEHGHEILLSLARLNRI